jgi:hypothetical protein
VKISGIRTEEELAELEQKANDSMETFLREHPEYEDNPEMKAIAMDLIRKSNLE